MLGVVITSVFPLRIAKAQVPFVHLTVPSFSIFNVIDTRNFTEDVLLEQIILKTTGENDCLTLTIYKHINPQSSIAGMMGDFVSSYSLLHPNYYCISHPIGNGFYYWFIDISHLIFSTEGATILEPGFLYSFTFTFYDFSPSHGYVFNPMGVAITTKVSERVESFDAFNVSFNPYVPYYLFLHTFPPIIPVPPPPGWTPPAVTPIPTAPDIIAGLPTILQPIAETVNEMIGGLGNLFNSFVSNVTARFPFSWILGIRDVINQEAQDAADVIRYPTLNITLPAFGNVASSTVDMLPVTALMTSTHIMGQPNNFPAIVTIFRNILLFSSWILFSLFIIKRVRSFVTKLGTAEKN